MELQQFKQRIEKELTQFFDQRIQEVTSIDPSAQEMMELLKDFTMRGGKRIRAALMYYGYKAYAPKPINEKEILKASMAVELIQSYLLIHDDIIDKDDLRRNGPTIHKSYENIHKKSYNKKDPKHFGTAMAIVAGDITCALANQLLAYAPFPAERKLKAIAALNKVVHKVIYGEVLDVLSEIKPMTEKDIANIHYLKTASYTVEGPLHIGAILAGAKEHQLKQLSAYAVPLGKAFQIQDDILGIFGDEQKLGKPIGSDIAEGKCTLLLLKAREKATPAERKFIDEHVGKKVSKEQLKKIRSIIKRTSALTYSQKLAAQLTQQAIDAAQQLRISKEAKTFLIELAQYLQKREL